MRPTSKGTEGERRRGREGERKFEGEDRGGKGREGMGREMRERGGGNGSMHPLGLSKVGAYDCVPYLCYMKVRTSGNCYLYRVWVY